MITYDPKSWFSLIFHAYSRQVFAKLLPSLIAIGLFTSITCAIEIEILDLNLVNSLAIHSMLGTVLGLFLVFRTNTAYERWWEGRKLWGSLVNNARNLSFKVNAHVKDPAAREAFATLIPDFVFALKEHLRDRADISVLQASRYVPMGKANPGSHVPNTLIAAMYRITNDLYSQGKLSAEQLLLLDHELKAFTDILGACERIKATPIPYAYSMYMKKFIFIYVVSLPVGLVQAFFYWTIPVVLLVFYILVSIELIAEEIEDPFGTDDNDLPTDSIESKIRTNVKEIIA
jgi:putative membrane protein